MKKKNLIILLLIPFLISCFCILTINTTYNRIDVDISYIEWEYDDMEGFQIPGGVETLYPLTAVGVNQRNYKVSGDDSLVWQVRNKDSSILEPCAEIVKQNNIYYLKVLREGEVIVSCSNQKGNVYREMTAILYVDAAILFYPVIGSSQTNIDPKVYYGEFDHTYGTPASIEMELKLFPESLANELVIASSENVLFEPQTRTVRILGGGDAFVNLSAASGIAAPRSFEFSVVSGGVNVYTYEDLLNCTNRSDTGEIVVLRKSFESLENAYVLDSKGKPMVSGGKLTLRADNVECFGNYDHKTERFSFDKEEIYRFPTTYNQNFIQQWNEFAKTNKNYTEITNEVKVGLHVQQDFYGNGFTINLHNLTYPYSSLPSTDQDGKPIILPQLRSDNLFRGPLKLYSLGDPNNTPLVSLYGQDNIGMYVEGDGLTVNDVNLKNCDFGDRFANLATVGTVMETRGTGITVKNSRISNGKNVLRSFSSMDLTVENCLLSNAQNFLFLSGSNEYVPVNESSMATFSTLDGSKQDALIGEFLAKDGGGDEILNAFLQDYPEGEARDRMRTALKDIQKALNNSSAIKDDFKGSTTIKDTYFYRSGIASICVETLFNGAFLQTASPTLVTDIFALFQTEGKTLIPYVATKISGVSYPVKVEVVGDSRFYDYKSADKIELDGLIEENMTDFIASTGLYDGVITIEDIFPLKTILEQRAGDYRAVHQGMVNVPVAFYGGGVNLSRVIINTENKDSYTPEVDVDLTDTYLRLPASNLNGLQGLMRGVMLKTVTTVTGFEPFRFYFVTDGYLYGEAPAISDLIANAKGE